MDIDLLPFFKTMGTGLEPEGKKNCHILIHHNFISCICTVILSIILKFILCAFNPIFIYIYIYIYIYIFFFNR